MNWKNYEEKMLDLRRWYESSFTYTLELAKDVEDIEGFIRNQVEIEYENNEGMNYPNKEEFVEEMTNFLIMRIDEYKYKDDYEMIDLDCSITIKDNGEDCYAANLWFEKDGIVVRWVYPSNGADTTSYLLEEEPDFIWDIIKSIKR